MSDNLNNICVVNVLTFRGYKHRFMTERFVALQFVAEWSRRDPTAKLNFSVVPHTGGVTTFDLADITSVWIEETGIFASHELCQAIHDYGS
jgi:hypothetical protein